MPTYRQSNGLTLHAFACGYVQKAELNLPHLGLHSEVTLRLQDGCWHLSSFDHITRQRTGLSTFPRLGRAREVWAMWVKARYGGTLKEIAKDRRYSYSREYHGEHDPSWITRFCGEWVGHSSTRLDAMLKAAAHHEHFVHGPVGQV
jgi:hypothetical protein